MVAALFAAAAANQPVAADVATDSLDEEIPSESIPEPITGDPVMPLPGSETKQKLPSEPYDIGPPEHAWKLDQLSPGERAAVERGRILGARLAGASAAVATGAKDQSKRARAEAAQHQLGIVDALGEIGVVP